VIRIYRAQPSYGDLLRAIDGGAQSVSENVGAVSAQAPAKHFAKLPDGKRN
jgi:hypothetical protein